MKLLVASLLALPLLIAPAAADAHQHRHHRHRHTVGTHARHGQAGFPITAASDSIRINSVGEVISQPASVVRKERRLNRRAQDELLKPAPNPVPKP